MPANLSPEYKRAEAAFKQAREPRERLDCLREMLRTIPKHKGTEHLQAEIKTRVKNLAAELAAPRKGAARIGPVHVIRPEGAAQIALLGPPNSGKSSLHARLTGSHAEAGPYPFTTQAPLPGMLPQEDVHFQLIDLPPLDRAHPLAWIGNALQPADAALLVVDLNDPDCVDQVAGVREVLAAKRVTLLEAGAQDEPDPAGEDGDDDALGDPFALRLPTLLVATKADLGPTGAEEIEVFQELAGLRFPALAVSVENGEGLARIGPWLFATLGVVRVYTKAPGRPPDRDRPFTLRRGATVQDVAGQVHGELAGKLRYARLWRTEGVAGQQVGREHPVHDLDVLELHA